MSALCLSLLVRLIFWLDLGYFFNFSLFLSTLSFFIFLGVCRLIISSMISSASVSSSMAGASRDLTGRLVFGSAVDLVRSALPN